MPECTCALCKPTATVTTTPGVDENGPYIAVSCDRCSYSDEAWDSHDADAMVDAHLDEHAAESGDSR